MTEYSDDKYATRRSKFHYNWKRIIPEETRKKISQSLTGREIKSDTRLKMSKAHNCISKTGKINIMLVRTIRQLANFYSRSEIKKMFPAISKSTINDIIAQRTWKENGTRNFKVPGAANRTTG